jgi:hypothetical protein
MDGIAINTGKTKQIVKLLNALPERLSDRADRLVEREFERAVVESKSLASSMTDSGTLANGIVLIKKRRFYSYASTAPYAAALEFGTKNYIRVPAGYERFAQSFKGRVAPASSQLGMTPKERIYAWAQRHGIPQRKKFNLYRRIMRYGMPKGGPGSGQTQVVPHFLPPYIMAKKRITTQLKGLLTRVLNGNA